MDESCETVNQPTNDTSDCNQSAPQQGLPPLPHKVSENKSKKGRKRSYVWDHFTKVKKKKPDDQRRAACNYCGIDYACETEVNGITLMKTHLET